MAESENHSSNRKPVTAVYEALDGMSVPELIELGAAVDAMRQKKQESVRADLIRKWRSEALEAGFSPDDLLSALKAPPSVRKSKGEKNESGKIAVKYRSPEGEEWSGRGRSPQWVTDAEKSGRKRDDFLVGKS